MTTVERLQRTADYGEFLNDGLEGRYCGYRMDLTGYIKRHWWSAAVPQYHFQLDHLKPLTFKAGVKTATVLGVPSGTLIQPCKYYNSDWGSVPSFLWWMYAPERFISWLFHDSAYEFHYVWICLPDGAIWKKLPITRAQADWAFCDYGLRAQDGTARDAAVVFNAVNLAGWAVWPKPACRLV